MKRSVLAAISRVRLPSGRDRFSAARRRAGGEAKDCPRGAWIELLTMGLLCRGAFQPGRFKASVDSRRRRIYIYVYISKCNNITGRVIFERVRSLARARTHDERPMRDQSYRAEKGAYPSLAGAETIQRLFIGPERARARLPAFAGNVGRKRREFVAFR